MDPAPRAAWLPPAASEPTATHSGPNPHGAGAVAKRQRATTVQDAKRS
jgi:hypothetical protein